MVLGKNTLTKFTGCDIRIGRIIVLKIGKEFTYVIEGRCQFKQDNKVISLEAGDSIFHNARIEHSITATEKFKFFSIYIKDKE